MSSIRSAFFLLLTITAWISTPSVSGMTEPELCKKKCSPSQIRDAFYFPLYLHDSEQFCRKYLHVPVYTTTRTVTSNPKETETVFVTTTLPLFTLTKTDKEFTTVHEKTVTSTLTNTIPTTNIVTETDTQTVQIPVTSTSTRKSHTTSTFMTTTTFSMTTYEIESSTTTLFTTSTITSTRTILFKKRDAMPAPLPSANEGWERKALRGIVYVIETKKKVKRDSGDEVPELPKHIPAGLSPQEISSGCNELHLSPMTTTVLSTLTPLNPTTTTTTTTVTKTDKKPVKTTVTTTVTKTDHKVQPVTLTVYINTTVATATSTIMPTITQTSTQILFETSTVVDQTIYSTILSTTTMIAGTRTTTVPAMSLVFSTTTVVCRASGSKCDINNDNDVRACCSHGCRIVNIGVSPPSYVCY